MGESHLDILCRMTGQREKQHSETRQTNAKSQILSTQPQECFLATTLAGIPASAALGGKERLLWRLKVLV